MKLLVYGMGRSGLAATRLALQQGHEVAFYDIRQGGRDLAEATSAGATRLADPLAGDAELCIAAPGVPIDHPHLEALRRRGVAVIGEVEWVWRTIPGRYLGITGTAGKGSTTSWISHLLQSAGIDAPAGGNIDPALAAIARPGATHVVELSSFMLERCPTFRPDVAVVLNLGVDHLDRHRTVAAYHAAKRNLLRHLGREQLLIYNHDDPVARAWAADTQAHRHGFSLHESAAAHYRASDDSLVLHGQTLLRAADLQVRGQHQLANALAVALVAAAAGLELEQIRAGLRSFPGLPGRYAPVPTEASDPIRYIDDSIATRELAVRAALEATPAPIVWLAGGVDKGADLSALGKLIADKVSLMIGIGAAGPEFCRQAAAHTATWVCAERDGTTAMEQAVTAAREHLERHHQGRGTVLLAPLAASFDQFADYRDRSRAFRRAVALQRQPRRRGASGADRSAGDQEGDRWIRSC